jgi:hypothetical protein
VDVFWGESEQIRIMVIIGIAMCVSWNYAKKKNFSKKELI